MSYPTHRTAAEDAAEAFYGQNEKTFLEQVSKMCGGDARLLKVFQSTRETYQKANRGN